MSIEKSKQPVALITGGTSGIGKETAVKLAQAGYNVVIVGRNAQRGRETVSEIENRSQHAHVSFLQADMSLMREVQHMADVFRQSYLQLDILIHSAGVIHTQRMLTAEGLETTFATDYLSRFLLTNRLLDLLKHSSIARVINIAGAGSGIGKIHFDDLLGARQIGGLRGLGQAQFANDVLTIELARRYPSAITFIVMHPGAVDTNIRREFPKILNMILGIVFKPFAMSAIEGAEAPFYLATSPHVKTMTGVLFNRKKQIIPSRNTLDPLLGKKLWDVSEQLIREVLKEKKS